MKTEQINHTDSNGLRQGLWRDWYDNDQLKSERNYVDDMKHGIWRWWYESGQPWFEVNYVNGIIEGESIEYGY